MKNWLIGIGMIVVAAFGAIAQTNPGTVSNHSVLVSPGPGVVGYRGAAPGAAGNCLTSNGASSDPSFQACAGGADITAVTISSTDGTIGVSGSPCLSGNCAFDLGPLGANSVSTTSIQSGAVTQPKIATDAITTTAIINSAVTNAKLADMAALTIKSNATGSTAAPSDNSLSTILDAAITTTQGAVIYRNASGWVGLDPGTSGQVLQTNGAAANPSWAAAGTGDITNVTITSTNSTLSIGGSPCTSGACSFTADLPSLTQYAVLVGNGSSAITSTITSTAGAVLMSLGNTQDPFFYAPPFSRFQPFTANGTFVPQNGVYKALVKIWGGGGGSGGTGAGTPGAGGGGGAYCEVIVSLTGTPISVTVGAGGTAGSAAPGNGGNGGFSAFGQWNALGGSGSAGGTGGIAGAAGGAVGACSGGQAFPGGPGETNSAVALGATLKVGVGGTAFAGAPAAFGNFAGVQPGGGAGGFNTAGSAGLAGGAGAVFVYY